MTNNLKRKTQKDIGDTFTSVDGYIVPSSTQVTIIGLTVANTYVNNIEIDIVVNDGVEDTYIVKTAPVPVGSSLVAIGGEQKVVLEPGDSVRVKSNYINSADVIMSIMETT